MLKVLAIVTAALAIISVTEVEFAAAKGGKGGVCPNGNFYFDSDKSPCVASPHKKH